MEKLTRFLSVLATAIFFAACGLPGTSIDNTDTVVQVTTDIPSSGQNMASNPTISPSDHNPSDGVGVIRQALDNTGLGLKMPLPAGYKWRLNTEAGGKSVVGFDQYHSDHYYSLDFGRHVQDNTGKETTILNSDGSGLANPNDSVDVLAATKGNIVTVTRSNCYNGGDYDHTCKVIIDHGNGYTTKYLHFKSDTIPVAFVPDYPVAQGQFLGKMGNTGDSSGAHVHFEVRYNGANGKLVGGVWEKTPELEGITLEGIRFADYKIDRDRPFSYYPSTNGFTYTPTQPYGANPRVCKDALLIDPWSLDYTCIQQSTFNLYRRVYSDALIRSIQQDVCLRAEVSMAGIKVYDVPEYCSSGIQPGSGLYYNNTNYFTNVAGSGLVKYYAHAKGREYLPAPFTTVPFTVLNSNTPNNQPAPVNNLPAHQSVVKGPNPSLAWTDAQGWPVADHDMYFWYWNGSGWSGIGWVFGWPSNNVTITGLPTNRFILWTVRSCGSGGCSQWSNQTYFYLQP